MESGKLFLTHPVVKKIDISPELVRHLNIPLFAWEIKVEEEIEFFRSM